MSTQTWNFDLSHSSIQFHVRHLMVSKVHGRFHKWDGRLEIDADNPSNSKLEVTIDAASIEGVYKSLRYNARRYPAVIVGKSSRFTGSGTLEAAAQEIDRRLAPVESIGA